MDSRNDASALNPDVPYENFAPKKEEENLRRNAKIFENGMEISVPAGRGNRDAESRRSDLCCWFIVSSFLFLPSLQNRSQNLRG